MNELGRIDVQEIIIRSGEALSKASGGAVRLHEVQVLSGGQRRNFLARATAIDADGRAQSVILKATRSPAYNPADENVFQTSGLAKEWVATALLAVRARDRGHGCMLLAGDVAGGILIFEDLGADVATLVDPLLKGTAAE